MYCYSNNGNSMRAVDLGYQPQSGEVLFDHCAAPDELNAVFPLLAGLQLIELSKRQLTSINTRSSDLLAALSANYPASEVASWPQQTREAEALAADPHAAAPLLSAIAAARDVPLAELAGRVRDKVAAYAAASGKIIGTRQALEDALNAVDLTAPDAEAQLSAIQWRE